MTRIGGLDHNGFGVFVISSETLNIVWQFLNQSIEAEILGMVKITAVLFINGANWKKGKILTYYIGLHECVILGA